MRERWTRLRAARDADDRQGGFSLIEVLITMIVFGIAMGIVTQAVVKVQTYARDVQASADANGEARLAVADIDRQVRSGNVLYSPANETSPATCTPVGTDAGTCMRVYTQANGLERCVQWELLGDPARPGTRQLRSRSWSPTWQTDGKYTGWAIKARNLNAATTPPFTLQGAATSSSSRYLVVYVEANDPRRPGKPVQLTSSLAGRNTNYGYDAGLCSPAPPA